MKLSSTVLLFVCLALGACAARPSGFPPSAALTAQAKRLDADAAALAKLSDDIDKKLIQSKDVSAKVNTIKQDIANTSGTILAIAKTVGNFRPQTVRIGNNFDDKNNACDTQLLIPTAGTDRDPFLHISVPDANDPNVMEYKFSAVCGQTKDDPTNNTEADVPGRSDYVPEEQEIRVHTGWSYLSGKCPRGSTGRIRGRGHGTQLVVQVKAEDASGNPVEIEEKNPHRVYFINPQVGESFDVELIAPGTNCTKATITITCVTGSNPSTYEVAAGQECYVQVEAKDDCLRNDMIHKMNKNGNQYIWTPNGYEDRFLTNVRGRKQDVLHEP